MAYLEGYPPQEGSQSIVKHLAFMVIVLVVITGLMFDFSQNWLQQFVSTLVPLMIILALMLYVSFKVNPKGWKRFINKQSYARSFELDRSIANELLKLDDTHYVIHNFTFELFHVEFLVTAPSGIFVLAKVERSDPLEIRDGILFQGNRTLETLTGNLWRVCNLINIVLKKGYQIDVMPQPVLIVPGTGNPEVNTYDDIAVVRPSGLVPLLTDRKKDVLAMEIVQGFSYYLKQRYAPKI